MDKQERDQIGSNKEWRANLRSDIESVDARRSVVIHAKAVLSLLDHIDALEGQIEAARPIIEAVAYVGVDFSGCGPYEIQQYDIDSARKFLGELDKAALTQAEEKGK